MRRVLSTLVLIGAWLACAPARVHAQNPVADSLKALVKDERRAFDARQAESALDTLPLTAALPSPMTLLERVRALQAVLSFREVEVQDGAGLDVCAAAAALDGDPDVAAYFPPEIRDDFVGSVRAGCRPGPPPRRPRWRLLRIRREGDRGLIVEADLVFGNGSTHAERFRLTGRRTASGVLDLVIVSLLIEPGLVV